MKGELDKLIATLMSKSYRRGISTEAICEFNIKLNDQPFPISIRELNVSDTKLMEEVYKLLVDTFETAEVDPHDHFLACAEGKTVRGDEGSVRYHITVAINDNRILAAYVWGTTPLVDKNNKQTDKLLFSGFYAVTLSTLRQKGMNRELYLSALIRAKEEAENQGKKISVIVGDVVQDAQRSWNRLGRRRLFMQMGTHVLEIPYLQPSLLFDERSGMPHDDMKGAVNEHLMIHLMEEDDLSPDFVSSIVRTLYWWSAQQMLPALRTQTAKKVYLGTVERWQNKCDQLLSAGGEIILLTMRQQEEMESRGFIFFRAVNYT